MNAKQTKLIREAATVDVDGDGWRKRMDRWLDAKRIIYIKLDPARVFGKGETITLTYTQP